MTGKKLTPTQEAKARIEAEIARVESDLIRAARERQQKIGIEADKKLLMVLQKNGLLPVPGMKGDALGMPATPQMISAIKLGLQRGGLLVEKQEIEHSGSAVIMIPAQAKDADEWTKQNKK
jgi:hypothetical protein